MSPPLLVSVILVNWNTRALADAAIVSLKRFEVSTPLEIILVDNASSDGSVEHIRKSHPDVRILSNDRNLGFARANNQGVSAASGTHVLLLNTDVIFTEEVLPRCLDAMGFPQMAATACRLLNPDGSLQLSADDFPRLGTAFSELARDSASAAIGKLHRLAEATPPYLSVDWLCGAFILVRRDTYLALGGLAEDIFMYGEDVEFCWRARNAGVSCRYVPDVSIIHLGGGGVNHASLRALALSDAGRLRAFAKMRGKPAAAALRLALMLRSASRGILWGMAGIARGRADLRKKSAHHLIECLVLAGALDAQRFV